MKTKHLFLAVALPAMFTACSNEELVSEGGQSNIQGKFITLAPNFALVQDNNAQTRGGWETNDDGSGQFVWKPVLTEGSTTVFTPDEIGYSWTGVCYDKDGNLDNVGSALTAYSDRVFTNYKFTHFAWKIEGEEMAQDPCAPFDWTSGVELLQDKYYGADWTRASADPVYKEKLVEGDVNITEGLFNTTNSTVYAGQYIVYAPYNKENVSNYIMATSKTLFKSQLYTKGNAIWENNNIFIYGKSSLTDGGVKTTNFSTKNLNGYVMVTIKDKDDASVDKIKKVILYDAKGRLLTKVGLSAKAIMDDAVGKDLYLADAVAKRETTTAIYTETGDATIEKAGSSLLIPVLPTEGALDNVEVILINNENKAVRQTIASLDIKANTFTNVEVKDVDFTNKGVLVTDELALRLETGNQTDETAVAAGFTANASTAKKTLELLGDIRLTTTLAIRGNYTLNGGRIIIPGNDGEAVDGYGDKAEVRMVVHQADVTTIAAPVINSAVLAEAAGCCKAFGGSLIVGNAVMNGAIETEDQNMQPNVAEVYNDNLSADKSKHGMTKFNVSGATTTMNSVLTNNGRLDIGRSDRGADDQSASKQVYVNVEKGKIQNNNLMTIFRFVKGQTANTELSAYVYVNAAAALSNAGVFNIEGKLAMYGEGKNSGKIYDRVSSTVSGNLLDYNIGNAEYICDVNDPAIRFKDAVDGKSKPTTTVRFVEKDNTYNFEDVSEEAKTKQITKYVIAENTITFKGDIKLSGKDIVVEKGATLKFAQYGTSVKDSKLAVENLIIEVGGTTEIENVEATVNKTMTVSGTATVKKGVDMFIGTKDATQGKLEITAYKAPAQGYFVCENNSTTTVYGDIVNNGLANIIEATATDGDIPAYLYYTNKLTAGANNWQQGGASLIK